jgi:hypothetical protein
MKLRETLRKLFLKKAFSRDLTHLTPCSLSLQKANNQYVHSKSYLPFGGFKSFVDLDST